eukprot:CAMPEP_0116564360 /NCGR_PEP_ID=MMETSP0397-20121206/13264_1 /TAXON_ID=216820 /ORGANISM="Cyclophora tenuis, Strain ECT3854" /LENGTH=130 /DNA_ID=CAMNT_0004090943 /DNA_START=383 /DNA_END=771 /DNA_ORIENTATION=+
MALRVEQTTDFSLWLDVVASALFLLSSILVYVAKRNDCACCCSNGSIDPWTVLDRIANSCFVVAAIFMLLGSVDRQRYPNEFLGFFLTSLASFVMVVIGILYVVADGLRHAEAVRSDKQSGLHDLRSQET